MTGTLTLFIGPTEEPLSIEDVADHLRVQDDDAQLSVYLTAARGHLEETHGVAFCPQTFEWALDAFPSVTHDNPYAAIVLPRPPLRSVTTITYVDLDGASQTLSSALYTVDTRPWPGEVRPAYGESWPDTRDQRNAVIVKYAAGYATVEAIPENLKHALRFVVGEFYEHREEMVEVSPAMLGTVRRLMGPYRAWVTP